jgi:hypothetical protein
VTEFALTVYGYEVMKHVDQRRGMERVVSSRDWQQLRDWHARAIPLPVVLEGVDRAFASLVANGKPVGNIGLPYITPAVEELWAERRDLYAGG